MIDNEVSESRQQKLYWTEVFQLKVQCEYTRRYHANLSKWLTRVAISRAFISSGGIAGWAIWQHYAFIWGVLIALSQLMDAVLSVIPITTRQKAVNALHMDLTALFIDALFEWEAIYSGRLTEEEISEARKKLMSLQHEVVKKHLPTNDLPERRDLFRLAEEDAIAYLEERYTEASGS